MLSIRSMTVALAIALVAQAAAAQALWQAYTYGMPLAEVKRAAPEAEPVDNPKEVLKSGARVKLRLPSVEIAGKPFRVDFFFIDDKLTNVNLVHTAKPQSPEIGRGTHDALLSALRSKYGNEVNRTGSPNGWTSTTTWASGRTAITLTMFLIGESTFIQIGYSGSVAEVADKL